ncbi:MAG: phospholipase D-like domain-containing protein [Bacteroidota bacterium]|nr:phospholipase D-like domain-containing protein [Bacteroidota bacterium]
MKINSYFYNISTRLYNELLCAKNSIRIAMCYFTNADILKLLANKAFAGIDVEVIVDKNASINMQYFDYLSELGCKIYVTTTSSLMHNKFCVIDRETLITGSYNWTYNAERNFENTIILENVKSEVISPFIEEFEYLKDIACVQIVNNGVTVENQFLTPLIKHRLGLSKYKPYIYNPLWVAKEYKSSEWITDFSWHPFRFKKFKIKELYSSKENLLLNNYRHIWFLNSNPICIKVKCENCNELLVGAWFQMHFIEHFACPSCQTPYTQQLSKKLLKTAA